MKIALLHYSAPPDAGSVGNVMAEHARLMSDAGQEIAFIAGSGAVTDHRIAFRCIPTLDSRNYSVQAIQADLNRGHFPSAFPDLISEIRRELETVLVGTDLVIAHNVCSLHLNLALTAALFEYTPMPSAPRLIQWHHELAWTMPHYRSELHAGYPWNLLSNRWSWATQVVVSEPRRQELAGLFHMPETEIHVIPNEITPAALLKFEHQTAEIVAHLGLLPDHV